MADLPLVIAPGNPSIPMLTLSAKEPIPATAQKEMSHSLGQESILDPDAHEPASSAIFDPTRRVDT